MRGKPEQERGKTCGHHRVARPNVSILQKNNVKIFYFAPCTDACSCNAVLTLPMAYVKAKNGTYKSGGRLPNVFRQRFRNNIRAFSYASVDTHPLLSTQESRSVSCGATTANSACFRLYPPPSHQQPGTGAPSG